MGFLARGICQSSTEPKKLSGLFMHLQGQGEETNAGPVVVEGTWRMLQTFRWGQLCTRSNDASKRISPTAGSELRASSVPGQNRLHLPLQKVVIIHRHTSLLLFLH